MSELLPLLNDGTKVTVDVTELVKNMTENDHVLSLAICDEKGYELAFASTEGAAKLDAKKEAAPVLRGIVKRIYGKDAEVSRTAVSQDTFAGSWSGDQSADFGSRNFLRTSMERILKEFWEQKAEVITKLLM